MREKSKPQSPFKAMKLDKKSRENNSPTAQNIEGRG